MKREKMVEKKFSFSKKTCRIKHKQKKGENDKHERDSKKMKTKTT